MKYILVKKKLENLSQKKGNKKEQIKNVKIIMKYQDLIQNLKDLKLKFEKKSCPDSYCVKNYREDKSFEKKCYENKAFIFKINCDRKSIFKVNKNDLYSLNFNRNACMRNVNKIKRL